MATDGQPATPYENRIYMAGQMRGLASAADVIDAYGKTFGLTGEALDHANAMRDGISNAINLLSLKYGLVNPEPPVQN